MRTGAPPNLPIAYALAAIPARYALERRDWPAAAALTPVAAEFPWERFPWAAAMTSFARALGAAHVGDLAAAQAEIAALQGLKDKLVAAKNDYWANQVEVQRLGAAAVLAQVQGRRHTRARAEPCSGRARGVHGQAPGNARGGDPGARAAGDLLLERKDAAAALQEYQAVLRTDPNRFRSVLGTARAAGSRVTTGRPGRPIGNSWSRASRLTRNARS